MHDPADRPRRAPSGGAGRKTGGRPDRRSNGRTDGRADGRADGRGGARGGASGRSTSGRSRSGHETAPRERGARPEPRAWEPAAPPPPFQAERWVDEGPVEAESEGVRRASRAAVARGRRQPVGKTVGPPAGGSRRQKPVADHVAAALERVASPNRAKRLGSFLAEAADALGEERLDDAHRNIGPVLREAPDVPEVRELAGQIAYRRGEWKRAIRELEAFRLQRPQDVVALPVLADCYRALGRHGEVDRLWRELRESSPRPEVMAEGRIVAAGSLADRGELAQAIQLLERSSGRPRRVAEHHLRQWYVLADLYDRSGETVQARRYFARIADVDRDFFDVADRLGALGR